MFPNWNDLFISFVPLWKYNFVCVFPSKNNYKKNYTNIIMNNTSKKKLFSTIQYAKYRTTLGIFEDYTCAVLQKRSLRTDAGCGEHTGQQSQGFDCVLMFVLSK